MHSLTQINGHSAPFRSISEAAVGRTFSTQTFLQTPLRNRLSEGLIQQTLFVKFNFFTFGDKALLPEIKQRVKRARYDAAPPEQEEEEGSAEAALQEFMVEEPPDVLDDSDPEDVVEVEAEEGTEND